MQGHLLFTNSQNEIITSCPLGTVSVALGAVPDFPNMRWFSHSCFNLQCHKYLIVDKERFMDFPLILVYSM